MRYQPARRRALESWREEILGGAYPKWRQNEPRTSSMKSRIYRGKNGGLLRICSDETNFKMSVGCGSGRDRLPSKGRFAVGVCGRAAADGGGTAQAARHSR